MSDDCPSPAEFIATVEPVRRRKDAETLLAVFETVTGFDPAMWGPSIIGFGRYEYRYASGREGTSFATGFAPRKTAMSIYIMPGYQDYDTLLENLGPHKKGKACLNITRLDQIDMAVLRALIETGLRDLAKIYPVSPR